MTADEIFATPLMASFIKAVQAPISWPLAVAGVAVVGVSLWLMARRRS